MVHDPSPSVKSSAIFQKDLFKGKVVFCTGGGSGIGYAQVLGMMRHGADAVILGRRKDVIEKSAEELSKETGRTCLGFPCDVRKPDQLKEVAAKAVEKLGRIDFVIAAAAGNFLASIDNMSENAFKTVVEIDLLGTYNTLKATIPYVKKTHGAYLADSATLHFSGTPLQAHVSAAKAGVDALIRVIAVEYGHLGIRANTLHPGPVGGTVGYEKLTPPGRDREDFLKAIPLQRVATLDDMINATIFLFSPAAANVTGIHFISDGGEWHGKAMASNNRFVFSNQDLRAAGDRGKGKL